MQRSMRDRARLDKKDGAKELELHDLALELRADACLVSWPRRAVLVGGEHQVLAHLQHPVVRERHVVYHDQVDVAIERPRALAVG